jgi:hypothetical protein
MRRSKQDLGFVALRLEGGILPAEFLRKVAALEARQQTAADYGLPKGLSLKDEIGRAWRIASAEWNEFRDRRQREDIDPKVVGVDGWLTTLLAHVLGYADLKRGSQVRVGERSFAISHSAAGGAVPLVLTTEAHDLDRGDPAFGDEGRRRSPHALVQEYLNAEDACLWGLVSNGARIRLLRDNPSLTRPAYIEADLERIFEEQLYADFATFWLIFHAGRVRPTDNKPNSCILERWREEGHETGERALASLRDGVTAALKELGNGFLHHRDNDDLRAALRDGTLSAHAYFQELLRLVYRLLFLATAEERDLLHAPDADEEAKALYARGYSLALLRERALKRRHYDEFGDLWEGLQVTFWALHKGAEPLGLPALGGLFASDQCPTLDGASIENGYLLRAIHALCFFRTGTTLARINYRDMDTEELGSVYESLLELHPNIDVDATPWAFGFLGGENGDKTRGSERKLSGSYYTPASLVNELIKSALEPVIEQTKADNPERPREALLKLKIVDPACGSGHFLLAAARRLAAEIARLDAVADVPDESLRRHALREVVRHCIYGVDKNPLAVELCKTALWIETVEPGRPLSFLDPHIRCGDSLVGILDPKVMEDGIPDDAYKPLTGDEKAAARDLKNRNKQVGRGVQGSLFDRESLKHVTVVSADLDAMPEDTIEQIKAKKAAWSESQRDSERQKQELRANLYVSAFFAPKTARNFDQVPLTEDLNRIAQGLAPRPGIKRAVEEHAAQYGFFHWHLAFPEVFAGGGFDVALGNPPWERIKLQEQEFFAGRSPEIANASNKAARERLIKALFRDDASPSERAIGRRFIDAKRKADAASLFVRSGGRYPLTAVGDVNTYALFAETFLRLLSPKGRAGLIVPTGIATDNSTKAFFDEVVSERQLASLLAFENEEFIFPAVHHSYRFCLLVMGGTGAGIKHPEFVFFARQPVLINDQRRRFTLSPEDMELINPNTRTCPVFRSQADAELTKKIYRRVPVLIDERKGDEGNPWGIEFMTMFHMSNDSHLFRTFKQLSADGATREGMNWRDAVGDMWVPLYEAKMIHLYDHRWATYEEDGKDARDMTEVEKNDPACQPMPRYWVREKEVEERLRAKGWRREWLMGWRDITSAHVLRTVISGVFPRVGVGHTLPVFFLGDAFPSQLWAAQLANWDSLVFDFVARQKIGGTHLTYGYLKQLPMLPPSTYSDTDLSFIVSRVLELTYTSDDLRPFAKDLDYDGAPFPWDPDRRAVLKAELDAYYARLYELTRDELRYILDPADVHGDDYPSETFRVLKKNEIKQFGEYRTQRLLLEAWDRQERQEAFVETVEPLVGPTESVGS